MAKKKTGKVMQMLSPENYIRTKARALPIHECLVNPEWKEGGFANIMIARSHTNGNITLCIYLIDLYCLGVKDSHYMFNISRYEYLDIIHRSQTIEPIPISYSLAHNIIYAGLEYAEEFGFKPHKDFTSITRFMLEEDTEDIELIDIECGRDGKPFYVSGPFDDELKINAVIKQLEKTAGVGNFDYTISDSDDELDQDEEDEEDEFKDNTFEEKKKLFLDIECQKGPLKDGEGLRFIKVGNSIFEDIMDTELFDKYFAEFNDDFDIEVTDEEISDEVLGILPGSAIINDETRNFFLKIYNEIGEDTHSARKLLGKFKKQAPDIPASSFLELVILQKEDSSMYTAKVREYANKFPDYSLIRTLLLRELVSSSLTPAKYLDQAYSLHSLFQGRTELHPMEMIHYALFNLAALTQLEDPSRLEAFICACEKLELQDEDLDIFDSLFQFAKIHLIHNYLTR